MASFMLSFFPLDVLDAIWDLIESVSEGFLNLLLLFHEQALHVLFVKHHLQVPTFCPNDIYCGDLLDWIVARCHLQSRKRLAQNLKVIIHI